MDEPAPNPAYVAAVQDLVASAPFPGLMGMRLAEMELDRCVVELDVEQKHMQPFGIVHGGVVATLIDTANGSASSINSVNANSVASRAMPRMAPRSTRG